MEIKEVNKDTLNKILEISKVPVIVDFYATWCGPCHAYKPILERFSERMAGRCSIYKTDIDMNMDLANFYKVKSVPTTIIFMNNMPITKTTGILSEKQLIDLIAKFK